jgi:hypothetical protein
MLGRTLGRLEGDVRRHRGVLGCDWNAMATNYQLGWGGEERRSWNAVSCGGFLEPGAFHGLS